MLSFSGLAFRNKDVEYLPVDNSNNADLGQDNEDYPVESDHHSTETSTTTVIYCDYETIYGSSEPTPNEDTQIPATPEPKGV
ncbi:unnamed protein product [Echinostoma caproni]|uniref:Polyprotein n=1 Tax=Echinostoma caproni TaxID=27848 RepID=A0A183AZY6_9TREM|nr:unnamed protein product [Echinostoma caproni]